MQIHVNYVRCERSIGAKQEFSLLLPNTLKQPMKTLRIDQKIDQNMVGMSLKTKTTPPSSLLSREAEIRRYLLL